MWSRAGHIVSNPEILRCIMQKGELSPEFSGSSVLEFNPRPVSCQSPISFQLCGPIQEQLAGVRAGS